MSCLTKKDFKLFENLQIPKYSCDNCGNKIKEKVLIDFVEFMPDNKLTCPFCMSLSITEVKP